MQTLETRLRPVVGIPLFQYTSGTTQDGAAIPTESFVQAVIVPSHNTALLVSSPTVTIIVEESEDGLSGWTAVEGATLTLDVTQNNQKLAFVRLEGLKPFIRARGAVVGGSCGYDATVLLYGPHYDEHLGDLVAFNA